MRIVDGCGELALATALVQFDRASIGVNRPLGDTPALHSRMPQTEMTHLQVLVPAVSSADQFVTLRALVPPPRFVSALLRSSLYRGLAQALTLFVSR